MAMADLRWVHKAWFDHDVIRERLEERGIGNLVVTAKNKPLANKDVQHALWNMEVLVPIMQNMKQHHLIKTPDMSTIQNQVFALYLMWEGEGEKYEIDKLPPIPEDLEIPIHLVVTSIKKLISFELFLDLPDPSSHTPDESEAEDEENHEDIINVSMQMTQDALAEPTSEELVDPTTGKAVLANDRLGVCIPLEDQECIFGLHKKIQEAKAQIAEIKRLKQIKSEDFPKDVDPPSPETAPESPETSKARAEDIKRRIEEIQVAIAKRELDSAARGAVETQPLGCTSSTETLEYPVPGPGEVKEDVWVPPSLEDQHDRPPQVVTRTTQLRLKEEKKDENAKGKNKGKNAGKARGSKTRGKKPHKSKHRTIRRLSSKSHESKQVPKDVTPSAPAEPPSSDHQVTPKSKRQNSKAPTKGRKALEAKSKSAGEAENGNGAGETGAAKNVGKRRHRPKKADQEEPGAKAESATKTKAEQKTSKAKKDAGPKKRAKKTEKKTNEVEPAPEEGDNKLPESETAETAPVAEDSSNHLR
eukprot:s920_g17.t1